jgi:Ferritin-like domain
MRSERDNPDAHGDGQPDLDAWASPTTRKAFLKGAAVAGAGATGLGLLGPAAALAKKHGPKKHRPKRHGPKHGLTKGDLAILGAAQVAEALAVTTYTNIINTAPFFKNLASDDQGYLQAARQEEMSHYLLEESLTRKPSPFTTFYYPTKMFSDAQTTLNILVTLEDAFIAAYLVGVRNFTTADLRVTAARIMGIESDHRTLARVVGPGVAGGDGGPIEQITGIQKSAESVDPPNNNGYERTLGLSHISQALEALKPFANKAAAASAAFDVTKPYNFAPFKPTLPNPLGEFHSLKG